MLNKPFSNTETVSVLMRIFNCLLNSFAYQATQVSFGERQSGEYARTGGSRQAAATGRQAVRSFQGRSS